jgi:hypothetical protein
MNIEDFYKNRIKQLNKDISECKSLSRALEIQKVKLSTLAPPHIYIDIEIVGNILQNLEEELSSLQTAQDYFEEEIRKSVKGKEHYNNALNKLYSLEILKVQENNDDINPFEEYYSSNNEIEKIIHNIEYELINAIECGFISADVFIKLGDIIEEENSLNNYSNLRSLEYFITATHIDKTSEEAIEKIIGVCEVLKENTDWIGGYTKNLYYHYLKKQRSLREQLKNRRNHEKQA